MQHRLLGNVLTILRKPLPWTKANLLRKPAPKWSHVLTTQIGTRKNAAASMDVSFLRETQPSGRYHFENEFGDNDWDQQLEEFAARSYAAMIKLELIQERIEALEA